MRRLPFGKRRSFSEVYMYPQIEVFGRTIGVYGLCAMVGIAVCVVVATFLSHRQECSFEAILLFSLAIGGGLLVGGHLLFGLTQIKTVAYIFAHLNELSFRQIVHGLIACFGGSVFYGGFLGGLAAVFIYTKYSKTIPRSFALDLYAVMTPLFHVFCRIGCFFGGCCYGKEWSWGFCVAENQINPAVAGVVRIPVQLLESGCNLIIFLIVLLLFLRRIYTGRLLCIYLLLYPIARFVLEFYRGDAIRGIWFGLSTSQWISIALFMCTAATLIWTAIWQRQKRTATKNI